MNHSAGVYTNKGLKLSDVLVTVFLSLVLGVVYHLWGTVYRLLSPLFFQADEIVYGVWFLAAILAFLLIRKPGVALIAEVAAAHVEILFGNEWGFQLLLYSIIQGLAAEIIFALFRYRNYSAAVAGLAGLTAAIGSFGVDIYYGYVLDYTPWMITFKYTLRGISGVIFAGLLGYALAKSLEATGVTQLLRPITAKDMESLHHD